MQWESGRTRHTLLQGVRESKAKRQAILGVLSSVLVRIFCAHKTCSCLPANPPLTLYAQFSHQLFLRKRNSSLQRTAIQLMAHFVELRVGIKALNREITVLSGSV